MAKYDKHCNDCDELFEHICRIADKDAPIECPYCGSLDSSYIPSAPSVTMRGDRLMTHKKDTGFKEVLQKIQSRNKRTSVSEQ